MNENDSGEVTEITPASLKETLYEGEQESFGILEEDEPSPVFGYFNDEAAGVLASMNEPPHIQFMRAKGSVSGTKKMLDFVTERFGVAHVVFLNPDNQAAIQRLMDVSTKTQQFNGDPVIVVEGNWHQ